MSRIRDLALLLLAVLVLVPFDSDVLGGDDEKDREEPVRDFTKLKRGMTPEQVRQLVGTPPRIARQILYHRYREQWIYETPFPIRLTFDCPRGQMPQLLSIPSLPVKTAPSDRGAKRR